MDRSLWGLRLARDIVVLTPEEDAQRAIENAEQVRTRVRAALRELGMESI
jgi:hypothetical protein